MNMNFSIYELSLRSYIQDHHPLRKNDSDFIEIRSSEAAAVFEEYSKNGENIIECKNAANKTLYRGLQYSLYDSLKSIIEEDFQSNKKEIDVFHLLELFSPIIEEKYVLSDDFSGSIEEQKMKYELIGMIQERLNNGL